jgi:uncharacterized membrane protein YphA (DoxX/SURF4 family)
MPTIDMKPNYQKQIYLWFRLFLGALFLWASVEKIVNPEAFAKIIENYHILPSGLVNLTALLLPWTEAVCGILLITGFFVDGAALILNLLLVIFIIALISSLYRGLDITCGCFSTTLHPAKSNLFYWYLLRDLVILSIGTWILYYRYREDYPII